MAVQPHQLTRTENCVGGAENAEWKIREQIAGVENAGAITRGNPSEEIS